ncbi:MAG: (Fe-S)-binding protein [Actinobacteria bacterium]|nr:(Fe-S)-binding protein [Actinomycetota bacterium]
MMENNRQALIDVLKSRINRQLLFYLDLCARCAICRDACHQHKVTRDVTYLPAYRAELIRRIYKKNISSFGKIFPGLFEGKEIDDEKLLEELAKATYACTGCRRCMVYCPFSIDTSWVISVAKEILNADQKGNTILGELADAAIFKGENIEMFKDILQETLKDSETELKERSNDGNASIPMERQGADFLYVALAGAHTILPAAMIFNKAKISWTLSMFEAANYGYFLGSSEKAKAIAARIVEEAKKLKVKEIIITECGHAYRVMKFLYEAWSKEKLPFKIRGFVELITEFIKDGKIILREGNFQEPVTYHDPCQVGRNAGFYDEPRYIMKKIASDFRDLTPNRERNWCCGGGGGLVAMPELEKFRIQTGKLKADQIKKTGAKMLITPCENCRLQIGSLNEVYNLGIKISSVMDFVANNMII